MLSALRSIDSSMTLTSDQASVKAIFKKVSQAWQSLTNAQILAWNSTALSAEARSVLGSKTKITGSNLFMRLNYWVVFCGGDIMETPPALTGLDAPASATLTLSDEVFTLKLDSIPTSVTNIKLIICASAPQSNGISRAYSKAAEFIAPQTPVTTAISLKRAYDQKYGAPSTGAPKVFVKYFYVNTATGEKSGEMLALATYTESE